MSAGILPNQEILTLCGLDAADRDKESDARKGPIRPCLSANVRSASYDLRMGDEYYLRGDPCRRSWVRRTLAKLADKTGNEGLRVSKLEAGKNEGLVIPANRVVIVSMHESVHLDDDMVGRLSLKLDLLLRGLIMANQSQVDAGYEGRIFGLLYNLSATPVTLKRLDPVLRLELERLPEKTKRPYEGKFKNTGLAQALKQPVWSSLQDLEEKVREAERKVGRIQLWATVIALAVPIVVGLLTLLTPIGGLPKRVEDLEKTAVPKLEKRVEDLDKTAVMLEETQKRLTAIQAELDKNAKEIEGLRAQLRRGTPRQ